MSRTTTQTRTPAGFGGMDPPARWPRPRSAPSPATLELPIDTLAGVGPAVRRRLERLGLRTVGDLLAHRPRRYERPVDEKPIAALFGDEEAVIEGTVGRARSRRRGRLHILTARIADATGEIDATWFNQPWLEKQLVAGAHVRLRGKRNRYGFQVDSYDLGDATETADFAPVYPSSEQLEQKRLRGIVAAALPFAPAGGDALPAALRQAETLPLRADALAALHRPRSLEEAEVGRRRLAFDELLTLQLALARRTAEREAARCGGAARTRRARATLPRSPAVHPHRRPGAGHRPDRRRPRADDADAAAAAGGRRLRQDRRRPVFALRAVESGRQGALMAPTEVLAEQHFLTHRGLAARARHPESPC